MSQNSEASGDSSMARLDAILAKSSIGSEFKEKVRSLVLLSKENGFVAVQDIAEFIPDSETDPELIEAIMNILDGLDIKLLDADELERYRKKVGKSEGVPRSYDRFDRYEAFFIKLGYEPLLKPVEVNELAMRIRESEQYALDSLFSCWLTLPFQLELSLKVLRKEERCAKVVMIREAESRDAYYKMLPGAAEECAILKAKLDMGWKKYLEEADPDTKARMRDAYRKLERAAQLGCKDVLRKFCFKAKLFEEWLDGAQIKSDIEDAIQIAVAFSASTVSSSPGPAGWQALYVNRARDIEYRWRLSPSELAHLAWNFRKHMADASKAKEEMVQHASRLVSLIVECYQDRGVSTADLMDVGFAALRSSVEQFNPSAGKDFTHYAAISIRQSLLRVIADKTDIGVFPVEILEFIEIIPEVHAELRRELGRDPSMEELANEMNIAIDVVPKLLRVPGLDGLSFSQLNQRGHEVMAHKVESDAVSLERLPEVFRHQLERILNSLEQREKEVIILRFGLLDGVFRSNEEVANYFKVSRENVRDVESSALRKIRNPAIIRQLQGMFDDDVG